jgi:hypothetical protein
VMAGRVDPSDQGADIVGAGNSGESEHAVEPTDRG